MRHEREKIERKIADGAGFVPLVKEISAVHLRPEALFRFVSMAARDCFLFSAGIDGPGTGATYIGY
jgi:hypothetical protein